VTDHPGEQFPAEVDPDVEPGYEPRPEEDPEPDYDSEPGAQSSLRPSQQGIPHSDPLLAGFTMYGELPPEEPAVEELVEEPAVGELVDESVVGEEDTEQAFAASLDMDEPAETVVEQPEELAVDELEQAEPEVEPEETVIPRPVVPSPASFQPRPPTPSPASFQPRPPAPAPISAAGPTPASVPTSAAVSVGERDDDAPHPLVEETMARLDELREKAVGEHAEVYADLHERLQTALVEADAEDRG
jgi:hypothetical protein